MTGGCSPVPSGQRQLGGLLAELDPCVEEGGSPQPGNLPRGEGQPESSRSFLRRGGDDSVARARLRIENEASVRLDAAVVVLGDALPGFRLDPEKGVEVARIERNRDRPLRRRDELEGLPGTMTR